MSMPPYIKQIVGHIHRSHPPTNFHSLISHVSLSLLKKSTLSLRDFGHGSCLLLQYSIYIHLIYIYIHVSLHSTFIYIFLFLAFDLYLIMLPHFTWKNFLCIYFMFILFCILWIRWYKQRTSPTTRTRFPPWR